jgi:hypothetical protein
LKTLRKGGKKMKRFTIVGVILVVVAVGVLLACTKVFTQPTRGSKYMKITISTETGKIVKIVDEKDNKATELTPTELKQIYKNQKPEHIGTILYTHSSPGCVISDLGGYAVKICF